MGNEACHALPSTWTQWIVFFITYNVLQIYNLDFQINIHVAYQKNEKKSTSMHLFGSIRNISFHQKVPPILSLMFEFLFSSLNMKQFSIECPHELQPALFMDNKPLWCFFFMSNPTNSHIFYPMQQVEFESFLLFWIFCNRRYSPLSFLGPQLFNYAILLTVRAPS